MDLLRIRVAAGSGSRIGELRALRIGPSKTSSSWSPVDSSLTIQTSIFRNVEQSPKTDSGHRTVEIAKPLNDLVKDFVTGRCSKPGDFLFANANTKPMDLTTLREHLDARLPGRGFHSIRRFRVTHLASQNCPPSIRRYWIGHTTSDINERYNHLAENVALRKEWAERAGLGFSLAQPKDVNA